MMDEQLKEATLAVLHNNEIIMQQTEDINTERGDDNHTLNNMRKIYDGIRKKIENGGEELTTGDCQFLAIATNITEGSLQRQLRVIEGAVEMHRIVREIYLEAATSKTGIDAMLSRPNPFNLIDEDEDEPNT